MHLDLSSPIDDSQHCEDVMLDHPILQDRGVSDRPSDPRVKPLLRIALLGGVSLYVGDREVALNSRKARALLAYLVLTPGMRETRDRLVGLLWSETEDAKARASLRQLLHTLREVFDREDLVGLSSDNAHVSLDGSAFVTDLDCALASVDCGDPMDSLVNEQRITDTFLRGYEDVDPSFGSWLTIKRESVRQQLIRRLETQLANAPHQAGATKRIAHALFQIDPTHEIACQKLMRACIALGNAGGALAAYKQLWECLEQEYDIEPSTATQALAVAIKSGSYGASTASLGARDARNAAQAVQGVDPVILLAVKLAIAWMRTSGRLGAPPIQSSSRAPGPLPLLDGSLPLLAD